MKYIFYNRGVESCAEWRSPDFLILNPQAGKGYSDIPAQMPNPYNENKINMSNSDAISTAIGSNSVSKKLFRDKFCINQIIILPTRACKRG